MTKIPQGCLAAVAMISSAALAAPVVGGAIGAATGASAAAASHMGTPFAGATGSVGIGAAGSLGGTAAGAVGSTASAAGAGVAAPGLYAHATGGAGAAAAMNGGAAVSANADLGAAGQAHALSVDSLAASGASASLNSTATVRGIRAATLYDRDQVVFVVKTRLEASHRALDHLRDSAGKLSAAAHARFDATVAEAQAREKALRRSLHGAAAATFATWEYARSSLASDYAAYAAAASRAEIAAGVHGSAQASD